MKAARFWFAVPFALVLLISAGAIFAQQSLSQSAPRLAHGIQLYGEGKWGEAIIELRKSQSETSEPRFRAEAQFWIAICELQAGDYERALHDIEEFQRIDPKSTRVADAPYHKARALYYLGRYNEALPLFKAYADSIRVDGRYANGVRVNEWSDASNALDNQDNYNRKASAIYWVGKCLYALEQLDEAETIFNTVITQYVRSHKYEDSVNQIASIKDKRTTAGLLDIIKKNQQNPTAAGKAQMDAAVNAYQQQLGQVVESGSYYGYTYGNSTTADTGTGQTSGSTPQLTLQRETPGSGRLISTPGTAQTQGRAYDPNKLARLLSLKTTALEMMDRLISLSANYDVIDGVPSGVPPMQQQNGSGRILTWQ